MARIRKETVTRLERPQSLVVQVEQALRQAIAGDTFPAGRLPTEVELAEMFGVSRETVRRAAEVLQTEGLLIKYRRRGTLLRPAVPTLVVRPSQTHLPFAFVQADYRAVGGEQVTAGTEMQMLHGAIDEAGRQDANVVVRSTPPDRLRPTLLELTQQARVRGAILASFAEEKALRKLGGTTLPLVLVDHDAPVAKLSSLRDDSAAGAQLAVAHLAGLGHRHIAYIHWRFAELNPWRLRGFREGMRRAKLPVRRAYEMSAAITEAGAETAVVEWLALKPRPTALICFNNLLAHFVIDSLARRGLRVPEDVSVVGCGGAEVVGLTTCQTDWYELGRQAMQILLRLAKSTDTPKIEHRQLVPTLRNGRTTAALS